MAIDINFEILIVCQTALLFTIIYLLSKDQNTKLVLGALSAVVWFCLGLGYVASQPSFPAFAFVFFGVGVVLILLLIHDSWQAKQERIWSFPQEAE